MACWGIGMGYHTALANTLTPPLVFSVSLQAPIPSSSERLTDFPMLYPFPQVHTQPVGLTPIPYPSYMIQASLSHSTRTYLECVEKDFPLGLPGYLQEAQIDSKGSWEGFELDKSRAFTPQPNLHPHPTHFGLLLTVSPTPARL